MKATLAAIAIASLSWGCSARDGAPSEHVLNTTAKLDASSCPAGTNIVLGTDGDDVLSGTNGRDCIVGGGGELIIRIDNATTGTVVSTWADFHTRWSLAPVGDDSLRGFLSALFGLHPFTYLRWVPADQVSGDNCP